MADLNKLVADLSELTLLEASQLVKLLEEKWGVSAAAPVAAVAAGPVAAAAPAAVVEEQTEFNVVLVEHGPNKINVIKVIRELTSLGLKEAKEMAETANATVLTAVSKDASSEAKKKLEDVGAVVKVQ
jgi:large subunit ribosomal protein L7/L12